MKRRRKRKIIFWYDNADEDWKKDLYTKERRIDLDVYMPFVEFKFNTADNNYEKQERAKVDIDIRY